MHYLLALKMLLTLKTLLALLTLKIHTIDSSVLLYPHVSLYTSNAPSAMHIKAESEGEGEREESQGRLQGGRPLDNVPSEGLYVCVCVYIKASENRRGKDRGVSEGAVLRKRRF